MVMKGKGSNETRLMLSLGKSLKLKLAEKIKCKKQPIKKLPHCIAFNLRVTFMTIQFYC